MNSRSPDRASSKALVSKLTSYFRDLIDQGGPSPSERELSERFGAGKNAIRDALIRLEAHGVIRRRQGAKLDINTYALRDRDSYTFREDYTGAVDLLSVVPLLLDQEAASRLETDLNAPAIELVRVLRDGDEPVALSRTIVLTHSLPAPDFDTTAPPRDVATALLGDEVVWLDVHPSAVNIESEQAALLDVSPGTAVVLYEILGLNASGKPLYLLELLSVPHRRNWILTYTLD